MSKPIKVFGNVGSPYTQKILALLRYRNIPYTVCWGDVIHNLSLLNLEIPKPVLLPTMVFKDENNNSLENVQLIIEKTGNKYYSNNNGYLNFLVKPGIYNIQIIKDNFKKINKSINIPTNCETIILRKDVMSS